MQGLQEFVTAVGYAGVFGIVFAESGLLVGFLLPGDSMLFTAGFLASQGYFNIWVLCLGSFVASVAGDSVAYAFGHNVGKRLFQRKDSVLFNREHLRTAQRFYDTYGGITIIVARFLPFIRTFAPIVAGIGDMPYRVFLVYNVAGGVLWAIGVPLAGYYLGKTFPALGSLILPVLLVVMVVSIGPALLRLVRDPEARKALARELRSLARPGGSYGD